MNIALIQSTTKEDTEEIPLLIKEKENNQHIFSKKSNHHIILNPAGKFSQTVVNLEMEKIEGVKKNISAGSSIQ